MSDLPLDPADTGGDDPIPGDDDLDLENQIEDESPEEAPEEEPLGDEPPQDTERQRRPTQSERRRQQLETTRRENEDLKRRLEVLERTGQQQRQPAADPAAAQRAREAELERLRMMDPVEAAVYLRDQGLQQFQQALMMERFNTQDLLDRQAYEARAGTSKLHAQYRDRVEAVLAAERQRGNLAANRDAILKYLVGEDTMQRSSRVAPGQRRAAGARVAAQGVRPSAGRGDVARSQGRGRSADGDDEALLRGITTADI